MSQQTRQVPLCIHSRRRVPGLHADESAITLVELMVAMALTAVIMAAAFSAVIVSTQSLHRSDVSTRNVDAARVAIGAISRDLRGADAPRSGDEAFEIAAPDHVRFTTRAGVTPELTHVDIQVSEDATVVLTRTPLEMVEGPDGEMVVELLEDDATVRVVARDVADPAVFRYFAAGETDPLTDLEDAEQRRRIDLVEVSLQIAADGGTRARPTRLTTTVRLPNQLAGR